MAITTKDMRRVKEEITRFGRALSELEEAQEKWEVDEQHHRYLPSPLNGSRESGAVRRASMDLSHALADMRKS